MLTDIAGGSAPVMDKLIRNYGAGLLHKLLMENWSLIPSTLPQLDPLTISDALQIQVGVSNRFQSSLDEIQIRLDYWRTRKTFLMSCF